MKANPKTITQANSSPPAGGCLFSSCYAFTRKTNYHIKEQQQKSFYKCFLTHRSMGCRILKHLKANILTSELHKILIYKKKKIQFFSKIGWSLMQEISHPQKIFCSGKLEQEWSTWNYNKLLTFPGPLCIFTKWCNSLFPPMCAEQWASLVCIHLFSPE